MTDKLPPLATHLVPPNQTAAFSPNPTSALSHHVSSKDEAAEEEPYTIKCICTFSDDDGNTIYCETCDTWQHIECFYPHNTQDAYREDFAHSCADCNPRALDHQRAFDRQSQRQNNARASGLPDKSKKRPPSKSHKKKAKPADTQVNGLNGTDANSKQNPDHPPAPSHKKSKSTHRASQSISQTQLKRSPSISQKNGNPHGHPPSPATTPPDARPEFEIHNYSSGFMSLYKDENDISIVESNSFVGLEIPNYLSMWLRDDGKLKQETGWEFDDIFQTLPANIDTLKHPPAVKRKKLYITEDRSLPLWYLTAGETGVEKDAPIVELNGQIGIQKDYCADPNNRWPELSSPLPFVFFHPMLPIYIDTRREGSLARYVRRSCKPNAVLDTFLSGGSEYHFWLVSDRGIAADEQVTIAWDFKLPKEQKDRMLQLLGLGEEESTSQPDYNPNEFEDYAQISSWIHTVLSEYGGCACDLGPDCAFMRFHRNYISPSLPKQNPTKKKSKKSKNNGNSNGNNVSPTSTGPATNSRAASEGNGDDGPDNDSGSARSKPPSRDMTPAARQGSFDTLGVLTELTDREKRKVQMVEDSFRRMEQQQPPRKKKRTSDGNSSAGTSTKPKSRGSTAQANSVAPERRYVDAGTSGRSVSGSPAIGGPKPSATGQVSESKQPSKRVRPEYCDAAVQTDPVEGEWFSEPQPTPKAKRRVVSLSKRLLESRHRQRQDDEVRRRTITGSPVSVTSALDKMGLESPTTQRSPTVVSPVDTTKIPALPVVETTSDIKMTDAPTPSPTESKDAVPNGETAEATPTIPTKRSPELRVEMPPPPIFTGSDTTHPNATTPLSASAATANIASPLSAGGLPSPFAPPAVNGVAAQPSPIKKKLSLSDYTKSRMNKVAGTKPSTGLKPHAISEEARSPTGDSPMLDSPITEKAMES